MEQKKSNEVMAYALVKLYVEEIARLGMKRKLDLDSIINAYMYTLSRLAKKEEDAKVFNKMAEDEIQEEKQETKEELLKAFM